MVIFHSYVKLPEGNSTNKATITRNVYIYDHICAYTSTVLQLYRLYIFNHMRKSYLYIPIYGKLLTPCILNNYSSKVGNGNWTYFPIAGKINAERLIQLYAKKEVVPETVGCFI